MVCEMRLRVCPCCGRGQTSACFDLDISIFPCGAFNIVAWHDDCAAAAAIHAHCNITWLNALTCYADKLYTAFAKNT